MEIVEKLLVTSANGLNLRAASQLAVVASKFKSRVEVRNHNVRTNAKSALGMLTLEASLGTELTFHIDGEDAQEAFDAISGLFLSDFKE